MKVTVVYCTARRGGLDILYQSMQDQTHKDLEVVVVDELGRSLSSIAGADSKYIDVKPPAKKSDKFWNLSASLNAGVRAATGELIVLLQDYIWVPEDGLSRFVIRSKDEPKGLISGVGHQYMDVHEWGGPPRGQRVFVDPRMERRGFYLCTPVEWEANWSCFRKKVWEDVGGFDEDFDAGWGYDNVNFAERAQMAGYHLFLDTHNEVLCYSHIKMFNEQGTRDAAPNNQKLWVRKYSELSQGLTPWKLNYANSVC